MNLDYIELIGLLAFCSTALLMIGLSLDILNNDIPSFGMIFFHNPVSVVGSILGIGAIVLFIFPPKDIDYN
jgi:hypothetical protein